MDFTKLDRGELIAAAGGVLLAISLFLEWYTLGNRYTTLSSCQGPRAAHAAATSCTGWQALEILRFLLLIAAIAPGVLAYIVIRGHALSWPRGELTAIFALTALTFTVFRGVIDKPGTPTGEIAIGYGWWVALVGGALILVGALWRSREAATRRKPPGVL